MPTKEVIINNQIITFYGDDENGIWHTQAIDNLIDGYHIELELNTHIFFNEPFEWSMVEEYMAFLMQNKSTISMSVFKAKQVLFSFFDALFDGVLTTQQTAATNFQLIGVDFTGIRNGRNSGNYMYDLIFIIKPNEDTSDTGGEYVWRISFVRNLLLGVKRDL